MINRLLLAACAVALVLTPVLARVGAQAPRPGIDWPSFRGIGGSGVAEGFATPSTWNVPEGDGLLWASPIEGLGHSSPVVWGDRVCVTTAIRGREDAGFRIGLYGAIKPVEDDTRHVCKLI